jgi:hypothetical protein
MLCDSTFVRYLVKLIVEGWTWGCSSVTGHLLNMCEALSSTPRLQKKKERKTKRRK